MPKPKAYNQFQNGQAHSKNIQNGFADTQNVDIHSETGSLTCQNDLEVKSTDPKDCYIAVAPNGDAYFFSSTNGNIYKRTQAGAYSTVRTNANGAHKGAIYYDGDAPYIYYTTNGKLGRFDLASNWNDSYQNLTTGVNHSMFEFDLLLYICNGDDLASVDETDVFSPSVLDVKTKHELVSLINAGEDLLLLGDGGDFLKSAIYRWIYATGSSWHDFDDVNEPLFVFLDADNFRFALANSGQIYIYSNSQLEPFIKLPEFQSETSQLTVNYQGKPLIANGNKIYSLYRVSRDLPLALTCEYTANGTITSIRQSGTDLLVSHTGGVDEISVLFATTTITTPLASGKYRKIEVYYQEFVSGMTITIETKIDGVWNTETVEVLTDEEDRKVYTKNDLLVKRDIQARITMTNGPIIDDIIFI